MKKLAAQDFYLAHPILDQSIPLIVLTVWHFVFAQAVIGDPGVQPAAYIGLSAVAGLVLTAGTFVCTMLYQSNTESVRLLRSRYSSVLAKNWASIFTFVLAAALLPILSTLLLTGQASLAFGLTLFSVSILIGRGIRIYLWLLVAFLLESSPEVPLRSSTPTTLKRPPRQGSSQ